MFRLGGGAARNGVFVFPRDEVISCVPPGGPLVQQIRLSVLFEVRFCDDI